MYGIAREIAYDNDGITTCFLTNALQSSAVLHFRISEINERTSSIIPFSRRSEILRLLIFAIIHFKSMTDSKEQNAVIESHYNYY